MDKQWKVVPIEPTEEMRIAAANAVGLDSTWGFPLKIYDAMLAAAPAQPPSASGEREVIRAAKVLYNLTVADTSVIVRAPTAEKRDAITAAADAFRAALAPPPGIDAVEQKPVVFMAANAVRDVLAGEPWTDGAQCEVSQRQTGDFDTPLFAAPPAAQASAAWEQEAERLVDVCMNTSMSLASFNAIESARAALLAHLHTKP